MRSMFDTACRSELLGRLRRMSPQARARWGRMTAPQMVMHLSDQMRHTLGDRPCERRPSRLSWPIVRWLAIHWLPWPKGRIQGPPEAFSTPPSHWEADLASLEALVERFGASQQVKDWPEHALFGTMSVRDWGVFCYRHFDHHLRQFGR